ncbi:MAG TPA: DUF4159 domain-containing protein [Tepidisphaeraceae bacterium]|nr:DUF4159 domain-containing protein [Tepidisphaeraceae bacterium]
MRAATPDEVQNAIDKAQQYLYAKQKMGAWEYIKRVKKFISPAEDPGGMTVTAVYALLSAGESPENPKLAAAIRYLEGNQFDSVYTLGMRCQVWRMLPPDDQVKAALRRDGEILVKKISPDSGMYPGDLPWVRAAGPYGVQGVWACSQEGMEIPTSYWKSVDAGWRKIQRDNGSWYYGTRKGDKNQTLPMTAAGVATLFIAQDELTMGTSPSCKGNISDPNIDKGLAWIGEHFGSVFKGKYAYYGLYGLEEIGASSGRKYFGSTDWYAQGADFLVRTQKDDGSWESNVLDTSFAMLFLSRGRAPVGFNKLQYFASAESDAEGNWNQRPRDLANFDVWMGREVELDRLLNWQVVNLRAQAGDLHDAPILYIAGDKALDFSDERKQKLKTFIEQGGMILFNADCGSTEFSDSVKHLAAELFPDIGEFRELPADHCILTNEQFMGADWKDPPVILGFSNGVRELMVLLPKADPSRAWQAQLTSSRETMFELGADLLLYASDKKNIREKGDTYIVEPSSRITTTRSLKVARIKYNGMWDPEPGGWRRLAAVMHNRDQLDLQTVPVTLGPNTSLDGYKVADITGTGHIKLELDDWIQLHAFVENGGTLIIDAAGGSPTFAQDIRAQLGSAYFDDANQLDHFLRPGHVLYTEIDSKIDQVGYRAYARHVITEDLKIPRIRGIKVGDRIGVFFSAEDISAGLVGEPVDGIVGYTPDSATALMEHMILYAESGGRPTNGSGDVSGGN